MQLESVHHVAIIASDYERSKAFYTEILGLKVVSETFRDARQSWKLDLGLPDGTQIELFTMPGAPKRPSYPEAQGLRHLAFRVVDVAVSKVWLEEQGITVEDIRIDAITGKPFTFFADPDGLPLELCQA